MHPLTRLLRSALLGTCHRLIIPTAGPATGDVPVEHARALTLIERLQRLPQFKPLCDVGVMDTRSDVAKWIKYENLSLRSDLKGAREKIALLHKYLGARGDRELKTWDLWRELQNSESTAKELRAEISMLKADLGSARNAAAAAAASSEMAKAHAQAETSRCIAARREAASAAARADAMEEAVDCMAQQLANITSGTHDNAVVTHPHEAEVRASCSSSQASQPRMIRSCLQRLYCVAVSSP
jgi:hypothetical protein